jgi:hypothetical protein
MGLINKIVIIINHLELIEFIRLMMDCNYSKIVNIINLSLSKRIRILNKRNDFFFFLEFICLCLFFLIV